LYRFDELWSSHTIVIKTRDPKQVTILVLEELISLFLTLLSCFDSLKKRKLIFTRDSMKLPSNFSIEKGHISTHQNWRALKKSLPGIASSPP
jgi:hypothetical protein